MINNLLEIIRWACVGVGIYLAIDAATAGQSAVGQFNILCIWVVAPVAGLTGIESVFFGKTAREQSGYGGSGAYQRQSGFNNLALGLTTLLVYLFGWGLQAKATVMLVLMLFLVMSAGNHAYTAIRDKNYAPKNLARPVMTVLLLAFLIPFMVRALWTAGPLA